MLARKTFLTVPSPVFTIKASPLTTSTTVAVYEIWYKKKSYVVTKFILTLILLMWRIW